MERKQASDFHPEVLRLFDQYVHGLIDRRGFLDRAARFAVNGLTATLLLDALNPKFAEAQQIAKDDARLTASMVEAARRARRAREPRSQPAHRGHRQARRARAVRRVRARRADAAG